MHKFNSFFGKIICNSFFLLFIDLFDKSFVKEGSVEYGASLWGC